MHVAESLDAQAQSAIKITERDQLPRRRRSCARNARLVPERVPRSAAREGRARSSRRASTPKRRLESADWQTLSLVDDKEVEEQMNFVRLGQMISHECEWQLRELAAYMGALLNLGRADDERNPLRAEIIGAALHRGDRGDLGRARQPPHPGARARPGGRPCHAASATTTIVAPAAASAASVRCT